jgi:diamine N-acetyltransferase
MSSLCEEYVASNALSIVQSVYEHGWAFKAIEHEGALIGFTMYGCNEEEVFFDLCRIMMTANTGTRATAPRRSGWCRME